MLRSVERTHVRTDGGWTSAEAPAGPPEGEALVTRVDESGAISLAAFRDGRCIFRGAFDRVRGSRVVLGDLASLAEIAGAALGDLFEPAVAAITQGPRAAHRRAAQAEAAVAEIRTTMRAEMHERLEWMRRHARVLGLDVAEDASPSRELERDLMSRAAEALRAAGAEADAARDELAALRAQERATFASIVSRWGEVLGAAELPPEQDAWFHALDRDPLAPGLPRESEELVAAIESRVGIRMRS